MLLLHLCDLLRVLLVHLFQFCHHSFTALTQSLFVVDELRRDTEYLRPNLNTDTAGERSSGVLKEHTHLVDEGEVSLDGGFVLFLLELEVSAQLLLRLLHMSRRQFPLLGLIRREKKAKRR